MVEGKDHAELGDISEIGEEIKKAVSEHGTFIDNAQKIGKTLGKLQPTFATFAKAICSERPLCWGCVRRAANVVVTVVKQVAQTQNPAPPTLSLAGAAGMRCPPTWLVEMVTANEVQNQSRKVVCESNCPTGCTCIGPSVSFNIAHIKTQKLILTDHNWQQVQGVHQSQCLTRLNIEFDLEYVITVGICMKGLP